MVIGTGETRNQRISFIMSIKLIISGAKDGPECCLGGRQWTVAIVGFNLASPWEEMSLEKSTGTTGPINGKS